MASIIEKSDGTLVVAVRITLKPGRDDALMAVIRLAPRRGLAATIREAMRGGVGQTRSTAVPEANFDLSALGLEL